MGSGLVWSLGSSPWSRPLDKAEDYVKGDLGGLVVGWYMGCNSLFFFVVSFGCAIPGSTTEGRKLKDVYNRLYKI